MRSRSKRRRTGGRERRKWRRGSLLGWSLRLGRQEVFNRMFKMGLKRSKSSIQNRRSCRKKISHRNKKLILRMFRVFRM